MSNIYRILTNRYIWLACAASLALGFFLARVPSRDVQAQPVLAEEKPLLCGKLLFLELVDSSAIELGLLPCDQTKPLVFSQRPAELFNYYRFTNATIKSYDAINTVKYGKLSKFITGWKGYVEIKSCKECASGPAPSATYTSPPPPPTSIPSPTFTSTVVPSPIQPQPAPPTLIPMVIPTATTPAPKFPNPFTYCCGIFGFIPVPLAVLAMRRRKMRM